LRDCSLTVRNDGLLALVAFLQSRMHFQLLFVKMYVSGYIIPWCSVSLSVDVQHVQHVSHLKQKIMLCRAWLVCAWQFI